MKKEFDFYEFAGVLIPGTLVIVGISLLFPDARSIIWSEDFTVGELGLSLVLGYGMGQVVQTFGNLIESIMWPICGGMPTDWVRTHKHIIISNSQIVKLQEKLAAEPSIQLKQDISTLDRGEWFGITRQIYATIQGERCKRVDIFNGNYGLHRGLAAASLFMLILVSIYFGLDRWQIQIWLLFVLAATIYRARRFGCHYARELFVQYLHK